MENRGKRKGGRADFSGGVFILQKADMAQKSVGETVAATARCAVSGSAGKQHRDKKQVEKVGQSCAGEKRMVMMIKMMLNQLLLGGQG